MTTREREMTRWLQDFVVDAMGASGEPRFCKRGMAAVKMLQRWLDKDAARRG